MLKLAKAWFTRLQLKDAEHHLAAIRRQLAGGNHRRLGELMSREIVWGERLKQLQAKLQRLTP